MKQKQHSENYDSDRVDLLGSPRKFQGLLPISSLRIHDHNQGSFGDNKLLNRNQKVDLYNKLEHNQSKKEECVYGPRSDNILFGNLRPETETLNINQNKPSMPGIGGIMIYNHASSLAEVSGSEDLIVQKHGYPIKSASSSKTSEFRKCNDTMIHRLSSSLEPLCRQQCSDDALSLDYRGRNEFEMPIMPQHEDRDKSETLLESHEDKSTLILHRSDYNLNFPDLEKGKEHISSSVEESMSISKGREDSHGSVESSSSKRVISRCKRDWSPDPKLSEVAINTKRQKNYGSSVTQGRSFKNWVSSITGGYITSDQSTPLAFVPHPSPNAERHPNSLPNSRERSRSSNISCKPIGFRSIFQSLYPDSLTFKNSTRKDLNTQREVNASEEHEIASEQFHRSLHMVCDTYGHNSRYMIPKTRVRIGSVSKEYVSGESLPLVCDGDSGNLHNRISTSSESLKHGNYHVEELLPTTASTSSKNSSFHEKTECNYGQECHLNNKGPYRFYDDIIPVTTTENKEASIPGSVSSGSLMASNRRTGFLDNLWIRRLFPKVSSSSVNTTLHNQSTEAASVWVTNKCKTLNPNDVSSNREQNNSQGRSVSDEIQDHSIFPIDPYDSKRIFGQNVKYNSNQVLPSQNLKKPEQMASDFAKKLGAFRHIRPSAVSDIATSSTITCFFCGKGGHNINKCSEIDETEVEDLLKNINSFGGPVKSSCLCIRCFQINHWAISCPHVSSKGTHITDNAFTVGYNNHHRIKRKPGNPSMSSYDGNFSLLCGGKQDRYQVVDEINTLQRGNVSVDELAVNSDVNSSMAKVVAPEVNSSTLNTVKEDIGGITLNLMPGSSESGENKSKENQIIPCCNTVAKEATDESVRIFETIRRLRLSHLDSIRKN